MKETEKVIKKMKKEFKEKKETTENFKRATELAEKEVVRPHKNTILTLKSRLGNSLIVECPKCGKKQHTQTTISRRCVSCHSTFKIFPQNHPSRVCYCPKELIPILHQLYSLENEGKFLSIL